MDLTATQIAEACGGRLLSGDPERRFREIAIDSRSVPYGSLFAAIPGARVDGHDFVQTAFETGAGGALVMRRPPSSSDDVVIQVNDTTQALQSLASSWRNRLTATVIGIAGSNGKTTTKETLAAVFGRAGRTWATPGNANSQVGAPLAVLDTPLDTEFVVLELGTSAPGELDTLAKMARPDHAIITAAFAEHLEWLESVEGVIAAETEILDALRPGSRALIGSAEPRLVEAASRRTALRIEAIGRRPEDEWRLLDVATSHAGTAFRLVGPDGTERAWDIPLLGEPAAWAGGFAIAIALELGLAPDVIQAGLRDVQPAAHRLVPLRHPSRPLVVLDDCYNSNPASCIAAIDTALALAQDAGRLILVVGDMLELGEATHASHAEVGDAIGQRASSIDLLIAVGPESKRIADIATDRGVGTRHVDDADAAIDSLQEVLDDRTPTTVLAKASRGIGLDRLVDALIAE